MQLFRIVNKAFLQSYEGLGYSYQNGACWNRPGIPVLYFAPSPAIAMLEMANYLEPQLIPSSYRLGTYELPDDVTYDSWKQNVLPGDWMNYPYPASTQQLGSRWLQDCEKALLFVPSAAITNGLENIIVFNPRHPDGKKLKLVSSVKKIYSDRTKLR